MTALYDRERTGQGRVVEASMFESVYASLMSSLGPFFGSQDAETLRTHWTPNREGEVPVARFRLA